MPLGRHVQGHGGAAFLSTAPGSPMHCYRTAASTAIQQPHALLLDRHTHHHSSGTPTNRGNCTFLYLRLTHGQVDICIWGSFGARSCIVVSSFLLLSSKMEGIGAVLITIQLITLTLWRLWRALADESPNSLHLYGTTENPSQCTVIRCKPQYGADF